MYNYNNNFPYFNNMGYNQNYNTGYQNQQISNFIPMTFVNGIEGAKAHIMTQLNSTIYLKDSDSDLMFVKSCDNEGKCSIKTYKMKEVVEATSIKDIKENEYITKEEFNSFKSDMEKLIESIRGGNNEPTSNA